MPTTLNVAEAAKILNCNPETIRRMCRRGDIEFIKLGNSPRAALRIPINQTMFVQALGRGALSQALMEVPVEADNKAAAEEADFFD